MSRQGLGLEPSHKTAFCVTDYLAPVFVPQLKGETVSLPLIVVRETGLEPVRCNHTPLKRARLPVPPLSHETLVACATRILYITSRVLSRAFLKKLFFFYRCVSAPHIFTNIHPADTSIPIPLPVRSKR